MQPNIDKGSLVGSILIVSSTRAVVGVGIAALSVLLLTNTGSAQVAGCPAGQPSIPSPGPGFVPTSDCLGWVPANHPLARPGSMPQAPPPPPPSTPMPAASCPAGQPPIPSPGPGFVPTSDCRGWVPANHPLARTGSTPPPSPPSTPSTPMAPASCPAGQPPTPSPGPGFVPTTDCLGWVPANHPLARTGSSQPEQLVASAAFPTILLPPGYTIEKVVGGLTYPTSLTWDNLNQMYVVEAGGQFLEEPPPSRILRITPGAATEVVNLTALGVRDSAVGITWYQNAFYFTHRAADRTGAVSRVTLDGTLTPLLSGIIDSQAEHQVNGIDVGPDGRIYFASGPATNAGVVGIDLAPFVMRSPNLRPTPCQNIVLTGRNYLTPDFRTADPSDTVLTGAFVPFGTPTTPGQVIPGTNKCGGAILVFDPASPETTLRPFAHGFRNVIGFAWNASGEMFAAVNGYDLRGSRPFNDKLDATYRVREGAWYGWPDFSAAFEPITDPKFDSPDALKAPRVVAGVPQGKTQDFVIDHMSSGLTRPDLALLYGRHPFNSSPSLIDVAPASWGPLSGQVFTAEWGDLTPPTNPLGEGPTGYRISRIDPGTGVAVPFVRNVMPGPASAQGAPGMGLERPFDVKFGPDGAMYIVDYGIARINPARAAQGQVPYEFPPFTGVIWKVTRTQ